MKISLIAAISENRAIGYHNKLPWRIPEDMKRFRRLTMGHHIIMGRKTFDSIGKPLKGRVSVILSHKISLEQSHCIVTGSLDQAIEYCNQKKEDEAFIIGGGSVFREALERALPDTVYLTQIHKVCRGDVFFPTIDTRKYGLKNTEEKKEYSFISYVKIK